MVNSLTWLHISDIHFHPGVEWRDCESRSGLLNYLKAMFERDGSLRPQLVFCTGDIAFGETGVSPIANQYLQAETFFDELLVVCGKDGRPLPKEQLFVVPGNHDVNRKKINFDAQAMLNTWASQAHTYSSLINQRANDRSKEYVDAMVRLDEYSEFIRRYLPHQHDENGRACFAKILNVNGIRVGIAGFNSAWSCSGPEDDRNIWLAAEWQFNFAKQHLGNTDVRIGLIHHPIDWLNEVDRNLSGRRIASDFHFWLHGHSHNSWVVPIQSHTMIAAGAIGAKYSEEFGINLVQLDFEGAKGIVHLHQRRAGGGWTIEPVENHAPDGKWRFDLPLAVRTVSKANEPQSISTVPPKRTPRLFGREQLLNDARAKLDRQTLLLVYGLRGNGKTALIEALGAGAPLDGKEMVRFAVTPTTTANELFRQVATLLGDTSEFPNAPTGDPTTISAELLSRYGNPRQAWLWIDRAHLLLNDQGFRNPEVRNLLLGLQSAMGNRWHIVLELRERPPQGLLGGNANLCEVPGLDRLSLAECLADAAPRGLESKWTYSGVQLKRIYQWLGGGHGQQAHPQAIQLLIEVARGRGETPQEVLERHLSDFEQKIEVLLLRDLFENVLSSAEQHLIQALALYRTAIPHDHADALERRLELPGSWDGLDRRCLLTANADHSLYYLHSFVSSWLRTRLGFVGTGEDDKVEFLRATSFEKRQHARKLHSVVADCWLEQLGSSKRLSNQNIARALEAFHHLIAAGEAIHVKQVAIDFLKGDLEWAKQRVKRFCDELFYSGAPVLELRQALEYAACLSPDDARIQRYLGESWAKEEGRDSKKALDCFEKACVLKPDFPPNWANLGRTLLTQGAIGAQIFLHRIETVKIDYPNVIDGHVRAIMSDCLTLVGQADLAAAIRMERIQEGSRDSAFYADEAKARLDAGNVEGALEILDLAEQNDCANDYIDTLRLYVLKQIGQSETASEIRMRKINEGSRESAFYSAEAKVRLDAGNIEGALEILDLAELNGCSGDYVTAVRANALQKSGRFEEAAELRLDKIYSGSRHSAFYVDEAKVRLDAGNIEGALEILDLAELNGCSDDYITAVRASALQKSGRFEEAAELRMVKISTGISHSVFYADEAKARLDSGDIDGSLEILNLAEQNGFANDYIVNIRANVLMRAGRFEEASKLRLNTINSGSRNAFFYADEAKFRLDAGNIEGALEILDLAELNGCSDDYIMAVRANALQKSGRSYEAAAIRMRKINSGSRNAAFYVDEAKVRLDGGDIEGALEILDLAEQNGCSDDYITTIRANVDLLS